MVTAGEMSENKKKWLAEAIVQAFECQSERVPVEVVAFSVDAGMAIDADGQTNKPSKTALNGKKRHATSP
jgi:hypothetical protein